VYASRSTVSHADVWGVRYRRIVVQTRWLTPDDELAEVLQRSVQGVAAPEDTVVVSEKVAVLLTGRGVPITSVRPGVLARLLAGRVRPRPGSRGLSVPEKMQYVLDRSGRTRLLLAAAVSAVTRPLGVHGLFYRVAGPLARDLDGGRPPFEHLLLPPLPPREAAALCDRLEGALGAGVAIVDINDFGGTVRATSGRSLPAEVLRGVLADNPLGQRRQRTPIGVVCAVDGPATLPLPAARLRASSSREP
jgi:F420-0:gamma-glutamyl ligase